MKKYFILFLLFVFSQTLLSQPSSFNLTSPTNGAYASATPYLVWSVASGVSYYQLYIDGTLKKDSIVTKYYQIQSGEAISEGLHTWNVKAVNGSGSIQSVETWSIRVDATLPTAFDLISPSDNSWTSSEIPTFQWSASNDAVSGLAKYQLWIDSTLNVDNISVSATSIAPANPLFNGSHSWQIKAIDNVGNVRTSTQSWTVKVDNLPPGLSNPYALKFNGTSDYVSVGNNSLLNMTYAKTIEVWANFHYLGYNGCRIISKNNSSLGQDYEILLSRGSSYTQSKVQFSIRGIGSVTSNSTLYADVWYHIAVTISGNQTSSTMSIYINGNLSASANTSGTHTPTSTPVIFGRSGDLTWTSDILNGLIDEVRIWNICKTQSQIQKQYNVPLTGNEAGLVGYWKFDEGSGTIAYDQTANNNGTIYGASYNNQSLPNINFLCSLNNPTSYKYLSTPTTTFSWGSATDAGIGFQKFQLWIDGALNKDNLSDSSWTITSPLFYGQHTWFVKGFDALGNNQSSYSGTFYVDNQPPNPFNLLSPNDSGVVSLPTPNLSWQATTDSAGGSGLSKYQLWINGSKNIDSISASSTTTSPSSPLSEGSYTWFIKAYDAVGNVRQSTQTRLFYVDYNPPTSFNLVLPINSDTIKVRRPIFTWTTSKDIGSGIAKYELNISGQSTTVVSPSDTSQVIGFDLSDGNYNWYVKAYDRAGNSTSSNTQSIIVKVPPLPQAPQLVYPQNNSVLIDDLTPDLAWNTVTNANYFDAQLAIDSLFTSVVTENNQVMTLNWTPTLASYGKYYWRVKTHSTNGTWGNWSDVWAFSIAKPNHAPNSFTLYSPINGDTIKLKFPSIPSVFKWQRSVDPDVGDSVRYSFILTGPILDTNTFNYSTGLSIFNIIDTTITINVMWGLKASTNYSWTVNATDGLLTTASPDTFSFRTSNNITGVNDIAIGIPKEFGLAQNYPNPFNPTTIINYQLPNAGHVTLKVFDMLGREVATLVSQEKSAGTYNVTFDANMLPSGVYFYRIQTKEFTQTKKLILIR